MTVEELTTNGNQIETEQNQASQPSTEGKEKQTLALSVHKNALLPNNRPIEPSHLEIVSTYSSVGAIRPVSKSGIKVSSTLAISGNRPISLSTLKISETYSVMGNRPVASNQIDDPTTLMGYID
jgi:hypothetical protein